MESIARLRSERAPVFKLQAVRMEQLRFHAGLIVIIVLLKVD